MFSLKQKRAQSGFTIVELLIVIVVIGILAALVVTTYSGIQAKGRDSQRQTDLQALQTQIEAFYANNNYYPALADMNSTTWRAANMKSLDVEAMTDPSASGANKNDLSSSAAAAGNKNVYGYVTSGCSGTAPTDSTGGTDQCTGYTLSAYLEGSKAAITKNALD